MKIDVITLHRVRNYGSSLQTLATQDILDSKGCETEIIDYYPERYTSLGLLKRLKNKSDRLARNPILLLAAQMIISVSYLKKKIVFDRFLAKHIHLTPKTYRSEQALRDDLPRADAYCTGSDQVWNSHWNEGVDAPFYLSFVPEAAYKFAYAGSIGNSTLSDQEQAQVKPYFDRYRHISVREDKGVEIFAQMGISGVRQVLDPTLLFTGEQWNRHTSDRFAKKKYVVTYNLHHDKRIDRYAAAVAKEEGLKVYNISYNFHDIVRSGQLKWCPTVEEYLGLIRDAAYVVTDSFHATVFSLLFHKPFMVIYPEQASSRIRSILQLLDLTDRGSEDLPDTARIKAQIDYHKVDGVLAEERKKAMSYLDMVLADVAREKDNH